MRDGAIRKQDSDWPSRCRIAVLPLCRVLCARAISRQLSVEYTPQQNGLAERANRTLVEMARYIMYVTVRLSVAEMERFRRICSSGFSGFGLAETQRGCKRLTKEIYFAKYLQSCVYCVCMCSML